MPDERTNLLPRERVHRLVLEYYLRFGVVVVSIAVCIGIVSSILLVPTYIFLAKSERAKETHLASIQTAIASYDDGTLSASLSALSNEAEAITELSKGPSVSTIMRLALTLPHPGITLSDLTYTPATSKSPCTLALSGTAQTRDALRRYQMALQGSSFVISANLPVSAYAKDTDITFTITVTLAP